MTTENRARTCENRARMCENGARMSENVRECARMSENRARIFCQTRVVRECENATRIECMLRGGHIPCKKWGPRSKKFFFEQKMDITSKNQKTWSPGDLQFNSAWFWTLLSTCGGLIRNFQNKKIGLGQGLYLGTFQIGVQSKPIKNTVGTH